MPHWQIAVPGVHRPLALICCSWKFSLAKTKLATAMGFEYELDKWASGKADVACRWYDELETNSGSLHIIVRSSKGVQEVRYSGRLAERPKI